MSIVINRVYTKVGDAGTTRLAGGQELKKDSARIEAFGSVDELNAALGIAAETIAAAPGGPHELLAKRIIRIQNELFDLGAELATLPADRHPKQALVTDEDVARLEREIDEVNGALPVLRSFILPGGGMLSAALHVARTVGRRAERRSVTLHAEEPQRGEVLRYLNRLSDWLFVMGRRAALDSGRGELLWRPGDRG
jgi:cob(I)alamin adenosyltransferase